MHSLGRRRTAVDSRRSNGQQAERWGKIEEVEKGTCGDVSIEKEKKRAFMLFTVRLSVVGFSDGVAWLTIW